MVEIEINGVAVEAEQGSMIIEAADKANIRIPRFCYHKKLSIAANCRMCLVEVEKARKPMPACATPVTDGMKVYTQSKMALESQKSVMEFLLINHPLDCPICDQGGECELQDVSMGYGGDISQFTEGKRVVKDKNIGPLIATDFTRCIHCTRCVRFGTEVAGVRELGATGRGEHTEIGTYIERSVDSELSGNVIDICPVGALTSKPFRFKARTWELRQHESIAPHDCVGSNLYIHTRRNDVMRVVPRENESLNEVWISDRDRFSYEGIAHSERAKEPMIRHDGELKASNWAEALQYVASSLQKMVGQYGVDQIAGLASPSCTTEELYLFQRLFRGMGAPNVDFRVQEQDFANQDKRGLYPVTTAKLENLEFKDSVLVLGSHLRKEVPIVNHRVRKVAVYGGKVHLLNPHSYEFNFDPASEYVPERGDILLGLLQVAKVLTQNGQLPEAGLRDILSNVSPTDDAKTIADSLVNGEQGAIVVGQLALSHPKAYALTRTAKAIATALNLDYIELTHGANTAGGWLAGCLPHRLEAGKATTDVGLNALSMFDKALRCYVLLQTEPELDSLSPNALSALNEADLVIAITPFVSESMKQYADVILPASVFAETSGTFINLEGTWQSFKGASKPPADARPTWKILRVLANQLSLPGFDYNSSEEIAMELKSIWQSLPNFEEDLQSLDEYTPESKGYTCISEQPIYAVDMLVRRADALQQTLDVYQASLFMNPADAKSANLTEDQGVTVYREGQSLSLPLVVDDKVAPGTIYVPRGLRESTGLSLPYSTVAIKKA